MDDLIREFVEESREGLDRMERCLTELDSHPEDRGLIDEVFRAVHTIKGSTGFLGFGRLESLAHAGETLLAALRTGTVAVTPEIVTGLLELLDCLRNVLRLIEVTGGEGQRSTDDDFSTLARLMELKQSGTILAALSPAADVIAPNTASYIPAEPEPSPEDLVERADGVERRLAKQSSEKALRVDVEVLNRMMNLVGELVLTRNQVLRLEPAVQRADKRFAEAAHRLDIVTTQLREEVMRARLQPAGNLFGKFPRLVRDLAKVCGKRVRIEFSGQETSLDKNLLEAVRDPLTHAIRNAIDHGIEPPEERVRAGKDPEGCLRLRAEHRNGLVVLELEDDGKGIAADRIAAKAVDAGLIAPAHAARMSTQEKLHLIFTPGFSTADRVTSVSGRGVGMDVVRENIEQAGGNVEVESTPGAGTTVRLRLPLTLAIGPALIVRAGGQSFAIPQGALREVTFVSATEFAGALQQIDGRESFHMGRRLLPLIRLDHLVDHPADHHVAKDTNTAVPDGVNIAVLEYESCRFGLVVNEIVAPEEIVVKPLSAALRAAALFSGAALLGSGELALILDVSGLSRRVGIRRRRVKPAAAASPGTLAGSESAPATLAYEVSTQRPDGVVVESRTLPLSAVERVEHIEREQVQTQDHRLWFCRGEERLAVGDARLEVIDEGNVWARSQASQLTAIVCTIHGQRTCLVVERVLLVPPPGSPGARQGPSADYSDIETPSLNAEVETALVEVA